MPLNTGAALAVSLIPAAVIVLYNIMESGAPGGSSIKNFVSSDHAVSESASSVLVKNISISIANISSENSIESLGDKIKKQLLASTEATTVLEGISELNTIFPTTTPTTTSSTTEKQILSTSATTPITTSSTTEKRVLSTSTTTTTTTSTTTTTTPAPIVLSKLSVCCNRVRVSGNQLVGNCDDEGSVKEESLTDVWKVPARIMSSEIATEFSLQTLTPNCKDGKFIGQLHLSAGATSQDHFLSDGMLKYKNEYYRPDEYCIRGRNGQNGDILDVQMCSVNCLNPDTPCVHKCCEYDEIYSMGMKGQRGGCLKMDPVKNETIWSPTLYDEFGDRLTSVELALRGITPHVIQSNPTSFRHLCPRNATTVFPYGQQVADFLAAVLHYPFASLKFMMRRDGWLMNPNGSQKNIAISKTMRTSKYCIDGVMNYGENESFMNLEDQTVLFLCLGAAEELSSSTKGPPKAESLVAAQSNNQLYTSATPSTEKMVITTQIITEAPTTTQTQPTTTTTEKSTTTTSQTTTTTQATTEKQKTEKLTTTSTTTTTTTKKPTTQATTTEIPTTAIPTTTTETPRPLPVLPVCCPLNPDANENNENENEISHHCKSSAVEMKFADTTMNTSWTASPNFMHTHMITKFRMEVKPLKCQKWTKAFVHNLGKLLSPTEPVLMPDGMLKMGNDYYRQGEFCVNGVFPNIVEVLVCKTNCSDPQTPCIQKCCAPNEIYSLGAGGQKRGCVPLSVEDDQFEPPLYKNMETKLSEDEVDKMSPHLIQKYPPKFQYSCYKNVTLVFPFSSEVVQLMSPLAQINLEFKLRQDGKVIYKHPSIKDASGTLIESAFSTYNFCVDGIRNYGEPKGPYRNPEDQTILFVCAVNPPNKGTR